MQRLRQLDTDSAIGRALVWRGERVKHGSALQLPSWTNGGRDHR
jgi:hypothetical protein